MERSAVTDLAVARRERAARLRDSQPIWTTRGELRKIVNEVVEPYVARKVAEAVAAERRRFIRLEEPEGKTNQ